MSLKQKHVTRVSLWALFLGFLTLASAGARTIELNHTWRGKDRPTNVLSFPMQTPAEVDLNVIGDLALCAAVIKSEARQQHKPLQAHWAHMVVHGMLHLQGYDHTDEQQAEEMEALEISILDQLGFDNPYLADTQRRAAD